MARHAAPDPEPADLELPPEPEPDLPAVELQADPLAAEPDAEHLAEVVPLPTVPAVVVNSTDQLTPDGLFGYAKAIIGAIALIAQVVIPLLPIDSKFVVPLMFAVALAGSLGIKQVGNDLKPMRVAASDVAPVRAMKKSA